MDYYGEMFQVTTSPWGVAIHWENSAKTPPGQTVPNLHVGTVRMSLETAVALALALKMQLRNYEENVIKTQIPIAPGVMDQLAGKKE